MDILKEKILTDGKAIGTEIIKVDSFLNHQLDVELLEEMGKEFAVAFKSEISAAIEEGKRPKILTIEASGIAVAVYVAKELGKMFEINIPVLFAKKTQPSTMTDGFYESEAESFTKKTTSKIIAAKKFLSSDNAVLIIDDFLARGEASFALIDISKQAGADIVGVGAVIEKVFQGGGNLLKTAGYKVVTLASIKEIKEGQVIFS
ncbi:MAG: xanthine phosphoribosyltransferase [Anaerovoracaceae bacterium]